MSLFRCIVLLAAFAVSCAQALAQTYTFSAYANNVQGVAGLAIDAQGSVYATLMYQRAVVRLVPNGQPVLIAGSTEGLSGTTDGAGASARFSHPRGIVVDSNGVLFVTDATDHTIRRIAPNGAVTTFAGVGTLSGSADGVGANARFNAPYGLAIDGDGSLYVADSGSHTIRRVARDGTVTTIAGTAGQAGHADGTGAAARFRSPRGIGRDAAGNLYVADTGNFTVRKISPAGAVTTLAGLRGSRGSADGTGPTARFEEIDGALTVTADGTVFIGDTGNYLVRKITPAGQVITLGGQRGTTADTPGTGGTARFGVLRAIAIDRQGTLYLGDASNVKLGVPSAQLSFTVPPKSIMVGTGATATFTTTVTGSAPISYQWRRNSVPIPGATDSTLLLPAVTIAAHGAYYSVVASNSVGSISTDGDMLVVFDAAVANDDFAKATVITGQSGQQRSTNIGATGEPLEPTHYGASATATSVWYRWTAPRGGTVVFSTSNGSSPWRAAYTGSTLASLERVAEAGSTDLVFSANAGTEYYVAFGSSDNSSSVFTLSWEMVANDYFAQALTLASDTGRVTGSNLGATNESGEPVHFNLNGTTSSLWYRWTPTRAGTAVFDTLGTDFDTVLAVYTGSALNALTRVTEDYNSFTQLNGIAPRSRVAFVADPNKTYYIAAGSYGFTRGAIALNWRLELTPVITSPPQNQTVALGNSTTLSVTALSALPFTYQWSRNGERITGATNATLTIQNAQSSDAGTYLLVATNAAGSATPVSALVTVVLPPPNDLFANAQSLTGATGKTGGNNTNATGEPGEPVHWNLAGGASSVWFRWTAPSNGLATIDTIGSAFDTVLAIYGGNTVTTLSRLVQDDDRGGNRASQVSFSADVGTTYYIAVGGATDSARGNFVLNWQLSAALAITIQPISQTVAAGGAATFFIHATGPGATYQWFRDGTPISGATRDTLSLLNVQGGADASYTVAVTNSTGTIVSAPAALVVAAPQLTTLSQRHAREASPYLWGLAGSGDTLVAVGGSGVILSSANNGQTWQPRLSTVNEWLVGVTYGNGRFVAVGDQGVVLTSPDGTTWTRSTQTNTTQRLNNVIHADGRFVAVGEGGTILTSSDAQTWTPRASGVSTWLRGIAYNAAIGHFAASGQGGVVLYSADGATWTRLPVTGQSGDLEAVVAVDSYAHFVAIGQDGMCVPIIRRQDQLKDGGTRLTWTGTRIPTNVSARLRGLAQAAGALFATGENGRVITAADDRGPWYTLPTGTTANLVAGLYHNGRLFIAGENQTILQSEPLYPSRLINISTRGQVGSGGEIMISGFVISGTRPKRVLVRAAGPALASSFGISGALSTPVLTLSDSRNRLIASNAGWDQVTSTSDPSAIATVRLTASEVGAFPFPANSADSALVATLAPGSYSAQISGAGNATGTSIVEVYDADALSDPSSSRTINISTRGLVGTGANKLIAGFVISGASSRRLLIRAVGPTLGSFGVSGPLAEPRLELYSSRGLLQKSSDTWGLQIEADEVRGAAQTVGAFPLTEGSKDAAMVVTLLPGTWSVQVSGANNGTGVALVEVYALP